MKKTLPLVLFLLVVPIASTPVFAARPLPTPPFWFECTAGYIITNIEPMEGLYFGIDAYHVRASSFGPGYDLVLYYLTTFPPSADGVVMPLAFYISNEEIATALGYPFTYHPVVVLRKGLTIEVTNLPALEIPGLPPMPMPSLKLTGDPSVPMYRPQKLPIESVGNIAFRGTWCGASVSTIPADAIDILCGHVVFDVRVTIA